MFDEVSYRTSLASRGTLLLPLAAKRISGGVWLYGAIRGRAIAAHVLSGWIAGRSIRLTPGRNTHWQPPIPTGDIEPWLVGIETVLGERLAHAVIQLPSDRRRRRFSVLLANATKKPIAFAKFTMNPPNQMAIEAVQRFSDNPPEEYWAPELIEAGVLTGYSYTVTSCMPNRPHVPARLSVNRRHRIIADIQSRLADLVSETAVAMHGDFGAWNVRAYRDGSIAIVDWEATGQGVPAADELWHAISFLPAQDQNPSVERFIGENLPDHDPGVVSLAARFWLERLNLPEAQEIDSNHTMPDNSNRAASKMHNILMEIAAL